MIGVARGLFIGWRAAALCTLPFLGVAFLRLLPPGANSLTALMRNKAGIRNAAIQSDTPSVISNSGM